MSAPSLRSRRHSHVRTLRRPRRGKSRRHSSSPSLRMLPPRNRRYHSLRTSSSHRVLRNRKKWRRRSLLQGRRRTLLRSVANPWPRQSCHCPHRPFLQNSSNPPRLPQPSHRRRLHPCSRRSPRPLLPASLISGRLNLHIPRFRNAWANRAKPYCACW